MKFFVWLALVTMTHAAYADRLTILSPHRKSIQREFVPAFKTFYKKKYGVEVEVDWLDQGGTSDDIRFLKAKYGKNPKTSGVDIFWGGGSATFAELQRDGFLQKHVLSEELKKQVPSNIAGIPIYDESQEWYGTALSSFGIFFNKRILKFDGLKEPKLWDDLAKPEYLDNISVTDPRRSGSANTMNAIILQSKGWKAGWELLTSIAGNTRSFTHSSSDPIKAVVSGDVALSMAIDFYAQAKINKLGVENLGFVLPEGQTVLDPDPIAVLKGAPNDKEARRFLEFVISADAQKLLILPKGAEGGPTFAALGRMSVNKLAYESTEGKRSGNINPFAQKAFLQLDMKQATKMQRVFNDLIGAVLVDTHHDLKKAWKKTLKKTPKDREALTAPFITQEEFLQLSEKWDDGVFRNKTINAWVAAAKVRYQQFSK